MIQRRVGCRVGHDDVPGSKKRREIAIAAGGKGFAPEHAKSIADQPPARRDDQRMSEIMIFVEILTQQCQFSGKGRRAVPAQPPGHAGKINAAHFQFHIRWNRVLVVSPVAIAVAPGAVHVAIERIGRHRPRPVTVHVQIS
ncbi:MAG: hypothetical protein DME19_01085 [Verrucomicrobia bacterium]|nr:MAG: hypothetical protein DME19_01085 [Verrucomicrobiota bacterium]